MAKVLYFSVDLHGHVNPTLGLIHKLVESGEEVIYYASNQFQGKVEQTGAQFRSYEGTVGFATHDGHGIDTFLVFADFILSRTEAVLERFYDEIAAWKPDYIIHDAFCYWGKVCAERLGVPGISLCANFPYIDEMADLDPDFFVEHVLRASNDPLYQKFKGSSILYRKLLDKMSMLISKKYGLLHVNVINDIFCSKQPLNLIFSSRFFQLHEEAFDDSYLFLGYPIFPRAEAVEFPFERLDGRPLIYLAFGTIYNQLIDTYKACFEAFADSDCQVIMSVGHQVALTELGHIPDNFIVRPYVPQLQILERADVFITHGGANSIYESIAHGVPMVVVPQVFDEFMGAMMVDRVGAGLYVTDREPTAVMLQQAVERVLGDDCYRTNCLDVKRRFDEAGGLAAAVERIFQYVNQFYGSTVHS
ncbi:hypothetical protein MH117_07565 [Paenibacillus sp. ACRRX]|uniref:macrolide family glycosyltransferase n=1 Tax=unclassified Paenibacillus TaxID=185978 RepID=UPI001EF65FD7|nr:MULTISPECIES: macrolide family glycosyltransferase [unclassified Paenibacillus]MCG7407273.1 hypothetical protein [Paenibacillus sp. ACRRX]MDK8180492.1 glycosyltransferase [Paenibacillus sp. UMB4589-SE434]